MALFLLLVLVAILLGVFGVIVKGLLYLLFVGVIVLVIAIAYGMFRFRRTGRPPVR